MDKILLSGIEFYAFGGISDAEKTIGQRYRADIELSLDLTRPSHTDALSDTVSYADVYSLVVATAREAPFNLLEAAAGRIAGRILHRFPVQSVTVRLLKLLPPIEGVVASAGVEITRAVNGAITAVPPETPPP